ncbi:hypothetical protein NFHSH190041_15750 [Shewanella sp. NFH-SH190041]|uniref:FixH family protein n=1 Tax=Shewanella sp. NFH-SH190041 TaxID=2950245 RepID=UPI0021C3CA6A|nr:FixH family protein [Shewanella sp. NFH-SH190041]BDM64123.1 hypothetical protein NFHSH190041_15750 [Shewanella sp. NFH-SH190041]
MTPTLPWYKQFWPWFLIILPTCVVIASLITMKIALDNADALVAEDYYKRGKAINMDLSKITYARQLGMQFSVSQTTQMPYQLILTQHGGPAYRAGLSVELYHPTLAQQDQEFMATSDPSGRFSIHLEQPLTGEWELRLQSFDDSWRLQQRIDFSQSTLRWVN